MKSFNLSIKLKIVLVVGIAIILINIFVAHFVWLELSRLNRDISREKLVTIARSTASQIDLKILENIQSEDDSTGSDYQAVRKILQNMREANPGIDDIYTMRKTENPDSWIFVVGADETEDTNGNGIIEDDETGVAIGEEYDISKLPEMRQAFNLAIADKNINCDKWGCFLSGYAPVRDETGSTLAIVGVDIKAEKLMAYERNSRLLIDLFAIGIAVFYPLVIFILIRMIIRPIYKIIGGLNQFSDNLSSRIKIRSNDEFGQMAESFNRMADEIQNLYAGMEKKVQEKTRALAFKMKEIQQLKAEDDALLASIGEGMVATDWNSRIIAINKVAEKMLGCSAQKVLGSDCNQSFNIELPDGTQVTDEMRPSHEVILTKQMVSRRYDYISGKNLRIPIQITASPVIIKGKAVGAIMVIRDITKEVEIDRAKSEFVSLASHQLRTPLTTINWYLEMIFDDQKLPKKFKKNLQEVYTASQKLIELVSDLLNVSRLELGKFIVKVTNFSVSAVADSVFNELVPLVLTKKIKIIRRYGRPDSKISSDEKIVRIILQNIITNAVKYTPPGGTVSVSVKKLAVEKKAGGDYLEIKVADTGYGIPKDQQKFIFTKLFRADNVKQKETEGNGLGMYIAKSFVEKLGGSITFVSEENKGTEFTIILPESGKSAEIMKKSSNGV